MKKIIIAIMAMTVMLMGCGEDKVADVELSVLEEAAIEASGGEENYFPNTEFDAAYVESNFGITEDMYEDMLVKGPAISVNVDMIALFKASDGKADEIEELLNAYRSNNIENSMQYPMNIPKISAAVVSKTGDYVMFIQLGGERGDEYLDDDEQYQAYCKLINNSAIDGMNELLNVK